MSSGYLSDEEQRARWRIEREQREAEARHFHGRRYYAGIALKYLIEQDWHVRGERLTAVQLDQATRNHVAKYAFEWADAMLAAEKEGAK